MSSFHFPTSSAQVLRRPTPQGCGEARDALLIVPRLERVSGRPSRSREEGRDPMGVVEVNQTPKCRRRPGPIDRSPATLPTSPIGRTIQHDRARGALNADPPRPWSAAGQLPYACSGQCPSPLAEWRMPDSWNPLQCRVRALQQPAPCRKVPPSPPSFTSGASAL
jgi:hypothetical protein